MNMCQADHTCTKPECCSDDDCPGGEKCVDGLCQGCAANADCDGFNAVCNADYTNCNYCDVDNSECKPGIFVCAPDQVSDRNIANIVPFFGSFN